MTGSGESQRTDHPFAVLLSHMHTTVNKTLKPKIAPKRERVNVHMPICNLFNTCIVIQRACVFPCSSITRPILTSCFIKSSFQNLYRSPGLLRVTPCTHRQAGIQTDGKTDRQTQRQTQRRTEGRRDRRASIRTVHEHTRTQIVPNDIQTRIRYSVCMSACLDVVCAHLPFMCTSTIYVRDTCTKKE